MAHGRDYEICCNIYIYMGIFDWDILWDTYIRDYGISSCGYCISTGYLTGDFWGRTPMRLFGVMARISIVGVFWGRTPMR